MSRTDVTPYAAPPPEGSTTFAERFSAWILSGPLTIGLVGLGLVQLATWIPHYLTWPFWADHDVFATMAQGWDSGRLPYRDLRGNNFPGTIYLFWILGRLFGWGQTLPFFAFDAALVLALGGVLVAWSRRRLGAILPGLVGYLAFLSYYLGLDYAHAAQRDWHGPFFAVVAILSVQGWPGRGGRLVSALAMALAVTFRPQTVLLIPALAVAIDESARRSGDPIAVSIRAFSAWGAAFALGIATAAAPLVLAGVADDLARGVGLAAYGSRYNRTSPLSVLTAWLAQVAPLRISLVPVAVVVLACPGEPSRRLARAWLVGLGGVSLYKPLSPVAHSYLDIPLVLVWSISLAVLVHLVLSGRRQVTSLQLVATLLILSLGVTARPPLCAIGPSLRAVAALRQGRMPEECPPGYRRGTVPTSAFYPWRDYRAVVDYLKHETAPDTRLANALQGDPALTAAAARPSAFPTESVAWLRMVRPDDEAEFAECLARTSRSVVVWAPGETGPDPGFRLDRLAAVIRRHYQPEACFGVIEVWRRKAEADAVASRAEESARDMDPTPRRPAGWPATRPPPAPAPGSGSRGSDRAAWSGRGPGRPRR